MPPIDAPDQVRSLQTDADLAITAASAGAAVVRSRFETSLTRFDKGPGDFATAADIEAEKAIVDVLRSARPADGVLGEEGGLTGAADTDRVWLVDPICGTLNFAAHTRLVAVNVALRTGSDLTAAAVADPFTGEIFWTDGGDAFVRHDGRDEPLVPSPESRLIDINLDPMIMDETDRLLGSREFNERFRPRVISTTLAVAWVAAGRRAGYVTAGITRPDSVHFSAGLALCRAAGCVISDLHGQPLNAKGDGLVVAADQSTHDTLLASIR